MNDKEKQAIREYVEKFAYEGSPYHLSYSDKWLKKLLDEVERLEKRIGRIDDIIRDKDYSDTEAFALILEVTENKWIEDED